MEEMQGNLLEIKGEINGHMTFLSLCPMNPCLFSPFICCCSLLQASFLYEEIVLSYKFHLY